VEKEGRKQAVKGLKVLKTGREKFFFFSFIY
jgi:hypothetical protein